MSKPREATSVARSILTSFLLNLSRDFCLCDCLLSPCIASAENPRFTSSSDNF